MTPKASAGRLASERLLMCRGSEYVAEEARPVLAALLRDMAEVLADGEDLALVVIGPVDFGGGDDGVTLAALEIG